MLRGLSTFEEYDGPVVDAIEFSGKNRGRRLQVAADLKKKAKVLSVHLPVFQDVKDVPDELSFDQDDVDYFVAHVTKKCGLSNWEDAWKHYVGHGKKVLFENHNQAWHPTDAGIIHAYQFKSLVEAGHELCLDTGHILQSNVSLSRDESEWRDLCEASFEAFVQLPIAAAHIHTIDRYGGQDHALEGYDIGPWVKRLVEMHPDIVLIVEIMDPKRTHEEKLATLDMWLR
jgi:hypothetical protein